ncbi:hypothetical protein [Ancylobacter sp. SL191]|uniref:hypothetical protein n=1 Tax=Ancylobacter sp. SL191 TaxID=2995166 RepID=UPI00227120D1|nr:hypothetical protein [Ancylobacter sp. SL191]WAC26404.1 hypothetical protein OU996_15465 [Ancylobacter sp. SL191]
MLARTRRPILIIRRRPWRRIVPVVRALAARGMWRREIARRLRISDGYVTRALTAGGGVWSPAEWERLTAAHRAEMRR